MEAILKNLSKEQRITLKKFRKILEDILTPDDTDYCLVKFLRARDFNLKESEKIFRVNYHNRRTFGVNKLLDHYDKPEVARSYETSGILGFSKNGSLIHYMACGHLDFYGFIMSMSTADLCLYFSHMLDYDMKLLRDENLRTGKNIHNDVTFIIDLDGFTLQQVLHKNVIELGLDFVTLLQETYPEIWCDVLVINAPKFFDKAFSIFKSVLRATALDKIQIVDKNSSKELLLKYIDAKVLPEFLGGKRVDSNGDPKCKEFIKFGGKVPEKLYGQYQRIPLEPRDHGVNCITVGPRSASNLIRSIRETGWKLRFQMRSNGSIAIAVFFKKFGPDSSDEDLPGENDYLDENDESCKFKKISVEIRAQSHCTQEDATIELNEPGIYAIRLSNIRNWFTSRKLLIKMDMIPPKKSSVSI